MGLVLYALIAYRLFSRYKNPKLPTGSQTWEEKGSVPPPVTEFEQK